MKSFGFSFAVLAIAGLVALAPGQASAAGQDKATVQNTQGAMGSNGQTFTTLRQSDDVPLGSTVTVPEDGYLTLWVTIGDRAPRAVTIPTGTHVITADYLASLLNPKGAPMSGTNVVKVGVIAVSAATIAAAVAVDNIGKKTAPIGVSP